MSVTLRWKNQSTCIGQTWSTFYTEAIYTFCNILCDKNIYIERVVECVWNCRTCSHSITKTLISPANKKLLLQKKKDPLDIADMVTRAQPVFTRCSTSPLHTHTKRASRDSILQTSFQNWPMMRNKLLKTRQNVRYFPSVVKLGIAFETTLTHMHTYPANGCSQHTSKYSWQ